LGHSRRSCLLPKNKTALRARAGGRWGKLSGYFPTAFSSGIRIM
jgi:hypothetical protein